MSDNGKVDVWDNDMPIDMTTKLAKAKEVLNKMFPGLFDIMVGIEPLLEGGPDAVAAVLGMPKETVAAVAVAVSEFAKENGNTNTNLSIFCLLTGVSLGLHAKVC